MASNEPRHISIHALRKERDNHVNTRAESMKISIHALRKERDCEFWAEGR